MIPTLEQLRKEGESGYKKITQYTRYLTVALAAAQSVGYVFLFRNGSALGASNLLPDLTASRFILIVTTLTAGTTLLMWLGELITQRGIGNGISLLIFASILVSAPDRGQRLDQRLDLPAPRAAGRRRRRHRGRRVHQRGPAPDPRAVRQAHGRQAHDLGPGHVHPAAREHGRRDPGDLRRRGAVLPAHGRAAVPEPGRA